MRSRRRAGTSRARGERDRATIGARGAREASRASGRARVTPDARARNDRNQRAGRGLPSRAATDRDVRSGVGRRAVVVLWAKGGDESFKVFRETRARTRARAEGRAIDDPMGGY